MRFKFPVTFIRHVLRGQGFQVCLCSEERLDMPHITDYSKSGDHLNIVLD